MYNSGMIKKKNTSHYDGPYWLSQYEIYLDDTMVGVVTKTGTAQDYYPWDWTCINGEWGHTGLMSEAIQAIKDANENS